MSSLLHGAINSDVSHPAIIEFMFSLAFSLSDTSSLLSQDGKNRECRVYAYIHVHLCILCVAVYKLATRFSSMLNSNS